MVINQFKSSGCFFSISSNMFWLLGYTVIIKVSLCEMQFWTSGPAFGVCDFAVVDYGRQYKSDCCKRKTFGDSGLQDKRPLCHSQAG